MNIEVFDYDDLIDSSGGYKMPVADSDGDPTMPAVAYALDRDAATGKANIDVTHGAKQFKTYTDPDGAERPKRGPIVLTWDPQFQKINGKYYGAWVGRSGGGTSSTAQWQFVCAQGAA